MTFIFNWIYSKRANNAYALHISWLDFSRLKDITPIIRYM